MLSNVTNYINIHTFIGLGIGIKSWLFSSLTSEIFLFFLLEVPTSSNEQFTVVFTAIVEYPSTNKYIIDYI